MNLFRNMLNKIVKLCFGAYKITGYFIIPNHYYEPVPDISALPDRLWDRPSELPGLDMKEDAQVVFAKDVFSRYKNEFNAFPERKTRERHEYYYNNGSFSGIDAAVLHSMIRNFKPKNVIEIGSGFSTMVSAGALRLNEKENGSRGMLTCYEPYPNKAISAGFPGLDKLEKKAVQDAGTQDFAKLNANDILFIDSSHVLKIGSDVQYEYLEILPRLNKGVIVHCHDICLPLEYPKEWIFGRKWFWTEQYLLQAFLAFNDAFSVLWAGRYMELKHNGLLKDIFTAHNPKDHPVSFWMKKTR